MRAGPERKAFLSSGYRPGGLDLFRGGDPFRSLHRQIDRTFDDVWRDFGDTRGELAGVPAPNIDVVGHDKETRITAELPDVREEARSATSTC